MSKPGVFVHAAKELVQGVFVHFVHVKLDRCERCDAQAVGPVSFEQSPNAFLFVNVAQKTDSYEQTWKSTVSEFCTELRCLSV